MVDPTRAFGKPMVEAVGIPTAILAAAYWANGENNSAVADWYEIESDSVDAAVVFETTIGGLAA